MPTTQKLFSQNNPIATNFDAPKKIRGIFFPMKKLFFSLFLSRVALAQISLADSAEINFLKSHIGFLASDKLEGRFTGSSGAEAAVEYISQQFRMVGLEPKGGQGYVQNYSFNYGKQYAGENSLSINGVALTLDSAFFPMNFSANGLVEGNLIDAGYGIVAPDLGRDDFSKLKDLSGNIALIRRYSPDGDSPHSKFEPFLDLRDKVSNAKKFGAAAVIVVNPDSGYDEPSQSLSHTISNSDLPVIYLKYREWLVFSQKKKWKASLAVNIEKFEIAAKNVVGFLNNHAAKTIVIGGHYDHLGWGDNENSLYRGAPAIHNGADDNASGTAGVIELARMLKQSSIRSVNFLFIAFSGEELGLFGSNYFSKNPTIDTSSILFMVNMDMIGRLRDDKGIEIGGIGTCPAFDSLFYHHPSWDGLKIKLSESGVGPSDHTSFYNINKPDLFFFTGTHEDYHKPSDDADKINYAGELRVLKIIYSAIDSFSRGGDFHFTATRNASNDDTPVFKVRLGIVPDYMFEGPGVRADGVTDGGPASKAGILKGDIILKLGEYDVADMTGYMKALGKFSKGDSTEATVKRGDAELKIKITF